MRMYNSNPKHEESGTPGRRGTPLDLGPLEALQLLNDPLHCIQVPGKSVFVGVRNDKIYVFRGTDLQGYHAYPVTGQEVCQDLPAVASQIAELLGTNFKRLSRMDE